jgi:hypothetical protein
MRIKSYRIWSGRERKSRDLSLKKTLMKENKRYHINEREGLRSSISSNNDGIELRSNTLKYVSHEIFISNQSPNEIQFIGGFVHQNKRDHPY